MPWFRLSNFEYAGYVADIDAHALPPNTLSRLGNANLLDGVVNSQKGALNLAVPSMTEAFWLLSGGFGTPWLLSAGASTIESLTTSSAFDVTPVGGLSTVGKNEWTGGVLHGIAVLNNGINAPQFWTGSGDAANLTNWPANTTCKALRPFKNFLFAGNMTEAGNGYPTKVRWSTAADPGAVPASWAEADPTKDSGSVTLSDTPGQIIDFQAGNDSIFCYKEDAVYEITYIGGVFIFKIAPRFYHFGLLGKNCTFAHRGVVYAFGDADIVAHTSGEMKSIASKQLRRRIFNRMVAASRRQAFVAFEPAQSELLFCVPWNSSSVDYAFTYNTETGKWGERDLPRLNHITYGKYSADASWDSDLGTWDSSTAVWGSAFGVPYKLFGGGTDLYIIGENTAAQGSVVAERKSIDFGSAEQPNERIKFVSKVRPHVIAETGVTVQVEVGSQMRLGDAVSWSTPQDFIVGTTRDLCFRVNGRYISWRVSSAGTEPWQLESLDFEVKMGAMW